MENTLPRSRPIIRRVSLSIIRIVAASCLGLTAFLFFFQSQYIYRPMKEIVITPAAMRLPYEDISFEAADGIKLSGWFIPADNQRGVILFCHGNAGNISTWWASVQTYRNLGFGAFLFDYRGYGKSDGKPTENGTYLDAEAALNYLIMRKNTPQTKIIVMGRSLGGAVAAWLARKHSPGLLIVESAFTSFPDIAAIHFPYLPAKLISRYKYNTLEYLQKINCPVLIVHSRDDEIVPFQHGLRLFEAANSPKSFLEISGSHNDGFTISEKRYGEGLGNFVSKYY